MKISHSILLLLCVFYIGFSSCKKDTDPNSAEFKIVTEYIEVKTTTATITGSFDYPGKINNIKVAVGQRHDFTDAHSFLADVHEKEFEVTLIGLTTGTEYRYRYEVDYGASKPYITEAKTFITQSELPSVKTLEVLALDSITFRVKCEVVADGGSDITERGIYWNTYGDPTIGDNILKDTTGGKGIYTIRLEQLVLGKKYYVRAYAKNEAGIGWSEEVLNFETVAPSGVSVDIELSCNPEEGGTVTGGGTFEVGTQCIVTAIANTGYTFVNWTENGVQVSSDAQFTFTVTTGRSLVANFTMQDYIITAEVDPENSGIVTGAGGYNYGEQCTLTATAMTGYDFVKWTKGGTTVSTNAEYSFTVTATTTYVAHFSIKSYSVSVSANPSNGGTVTGGGTFDYGESRTVHATPANGFAFTNWTDDGDEVSTDADYTFTVSSNRNLVANFTVLQPNEYSIAVSTNPSEGGTVTGSGTYQQGQSCTVKATSKPNFTFVNWTENGNQVSDLAEYTFTVTGNRILVANFEAQAPTEYTVSVSANPSNGGTVTGSGTYQQGQQCSVMATVNDGYNFTNWTEGGNVVSTQASYTFTVISDRNLVANFTYQGGGGSAPQGAINGQFTINSSGDKVYFAKGNLQYNKTTQQWSFMEHQYDMVETDGQIVGENYANQNIVSLFGWGTSGWDNGNVYYQPYNTQDNGNSSQGYGYGPTDGTNYTYNLTGAYSHADWGVHNSISGTTGSWRTLTGGYDNNNSEWSYVLFSRNASTVNGVPNARHAKAVVAGVHGVILFPDSYTHPFGVAQPIGINQTIGSTGWNGNNYTATDFGMMQDAGAVFLPASGYRTGTSVHGVGSNGNYWSASYYNSSYNSIYAGYVYFNVLDLYSSGNLNYYGLSVRLVCPCQ